MSRALHSDQRYPHSPGCTECRAAQLCNVCGFPASKADRCTNGRCHACHRAVCGHGGEQSSGHGYGTPHAAEVQARRRRDGKVQTEAKSAVIETEAVARSTCLQLVKDGRNFSCERTAAGWVFTVYPETGGQSR